MNSLTCDYCGGNDFYKDRGFYYCNDCQVQSQAIQEQEHEVPDVADGAVVQKATKVKKKQEENEENRLTSWECYNYILLGLVNELTELGANKNLKKTVKVLWYKYLRHLEVIGKNGQQNPKLPALNNKADAEIIYGRKRARSRSRSRSRSVASGGSSSLDTTSYKERARKKRMLESEEYLSTQQSDTTSLNNQSLASLQSSNGSSKQDQYLSYNKSGRTEMKKHMTTNKFKEHCKDVDFMYESRFISYREATAKYKHSADVLTRNKVVGLIYLGLLINKDVIHLGDVLRYMKEGHLSYNEYTHFFPESLANKKLNIATYAEKSSFLCHQKMREISAKLAHTLKISAYLPHANILALCERYCKELNLPDELFNFIRCLMSKVPPSMLFRPKSKFVPNYEGRAISFIVFTLKLLLGLDGSAEKKISKIVDKINKQNSSSIQLFNFEKWLEFIEYRKCVMEEEHFASYVAGNKHDKPNLFVNFLKEHRSKYEEKLTDNFTIGMLKNNLEKLQSFQPGAANTNFFKHSLTPYKDYTETLLNLNNCDKYSYEILSQNFNETTLEYLISSELFKEVIYDNLDSNTSLCNDKIKFVPSTSVKNDQDKINRELRKLVTIELVNEEVPSKQSDKSESFCSEKLHEKFLEINKKKHAKNMKQFKATNSKEEVEDFYQPFEKFWIQAHDIPAMTNQDFDNFVITLPYSFQLVMKECKRITGQSLKSLYEEYSLTELYLSYKGKFISNYKKTEANYNARLLKLLKAAESNW